MPDVTSRIVRRSAWAAAVLLFTVGLACNWCIVRLVDDAAASARLRVARRAAMAVVHDILSGESGQRGYLLTGDPGYLEPFTEAADRLEKDLARLAELTRDDHLPTNVTTDLERVARAKFAELRACWESNLASVGRSRLPSAA